MGKYVEIIETTLRDGQQSLWATRMTTPMLLPILPLLDSIGFRHVEVMGTAVMDAAVRWLKENPWERFRILRRLMPASKLVMINSCLGFSVGRGGMPDDMLSLFYERCAVNGMDAFFVLDGLNDIRNFEVPVHTLRKTGSTLMGAIVFSISPVHTDAYFVERVQELVAWGVDILVLKDPNGVLTPERVRTLVPALLAVSGDRPVYCHSHCVTGLGPATNLEAVRCGATGIWTAASPLANGSSLPATESMVRHLERMGCELRLDHGGIEPISAHFRQVAARYQKPLGQPAEYDPSFYQHQMPGGMISNFRAQLGQLGIADRLDEVLDEIPRVREDLGWTLMVTPFSQIIGTQSALNVLYGRYQVILSDVERITLGHYGQTPAPVNPDLLDRAGKGREPIKDRPARHLAPAVERFRREHGPFASDDDLLLAYFFMPDQLQAMRDAGPIPTADRPATTPLVELVRTVARRPEVRRLHFVSGG